jgi:hypothetical protein
MIQQPMSKRPSTDGLYNFSHNTNLMLITDHFCALSLLLNDTEETKNSGKAVSVPLHATVVLGWRGSIAPTHSPPRN